MPALERSQLRTLALVGHAGTGKTTMIEMLLAASGAIETPGSVERGSTVSDYDPIEKAHGHSLRLACAHFETDGVRVHLLDTPGYPDFSGRALGALDAVETVGIVINAQRGIEITATRMALWAKARRLCRMVIVNRIDEEGVDLPGVLSDLQAAFGRECLPVNLPAAGATKVLDCFFNVSGDATDFGSVSDAHQALIEQIVEVDDDLTERYLGGEEISAQELHDVFERALREGHILPVMFTSARTGAGINELRDFIVRMAPDPSEGNPPLFEKWPGGDPEKAVPHTSTGDPADHVLAHVFKIEVDPYVGTIGLVRVHQGTITPDTQLYVGDARKPVKTGALMLAQGKDLTPLAAAGPGEICAVTKIDGLTFDTVLHDAPEDAVVHFKPLPMPHAVYGLAVRVKKRGEEQKLSEILHRLISEVPSLTVEHDATTHEMVIRGIGEMHVGRVIERIASLYKLELEAHPPAIPYRETINAAAEGHHRHKKQSGGAGQFGEVYLRVAPLARGEGFKFLDEVKGGVIPSVFIPAVEKGVRQVLAEGAIAGFPVQDVQVTVYDGKSHPVDGKEIAFITAGRKAFIDAVLKARPTVLEPIVNLEVTLPEDHIGTVAGELSSRRGQISGTGVGRAGTATVTGRAPLAELDDFQGRLKAITAGQGSFTLELAGYEEAPPQVTAKLKAAFKPAADE